MPPGDTAEYRFTEVQETICRRASTILGIVYENGGEVVWQTSAASPILQVTSVQGLLDGVHALIIYVASCAHGSPLAPAWLIATSHQDLAALGALCSHRFGHQQAGGKRRRDGSAAHSPAVSIPLTLAGRLAHFGGPLVDSTAEKLTSA